MNKISSCLVLVMFLLVLPMGFAQCSDAFPKTTVLQGARATPVIMDIVIDRSAHYAVIPINHSIVAAHTKNGVFEASFNYTGIYDFYQILISADGCYEVQPLQIHILDNPYIKYYSPEVSAQISEGDILYFSVEAYSSASPPKLFYSWKFNGEQISTDTGFVLPTDYGSAGEHHISLEIMDVSRRKTTKDWYITINDVNRPPYLAAAIPDFTYAGRVPQPFLNLYHYFDDPDDEALYFTIEPSSVAYATEGKLYPKSLGQNTTITITAQDKAGLKVTSNTFTITYLEQSIQAYMEDVESCEPEIVCEEWSDCLPQGQQVQKCYDTMGCKSVSIANTRACAYQPTCFDQVLNQGEEQIDCGGPCTSCATCTDNQMNGAEEGIDCGGPCDPCPTCFDQIKNQDESDIDCGGVCSTCEVGLVCNVHSDCSSLHCKNNMCIEATCNDKRLNQGEARVDCGGPCDPCPACTDGIKNQGEEQIDCGGPCQACATCNDGIRNQGELFTDCFGPCPCGNNMLQYAWYLLVIPGFIIMVLSVKIIKQHSQHMSFTLAKTLQYLPLKQPENLYEHLEDYENALNKLLIRAVKHDEQTQLHKDFALAKINFFEAAFEESQTFNLVKRAIKKHLFNIFLASLFYTLYKMGELDDNSPLYHVELQHKIHDMKVLIDEILSILRK